MSKEIQKKSSHCASLVEYSNSIKEVIKKSNCKLCQSEHRAEAEQIWDTKNNYTAIRNFLESKGEKVSITSIRRHILNHYQKQEEDMRLKEYAEDVQKWLSIKQTRKQSLEERIAILRKSLAYIGSETEGKSLNEHRLSADAMKRISDTISSLEDKIEEQEEMMQPAILIISELRNIISDKIKSTDDKQTKEILMSVIEELTEKVGDLEINE